VFCSWTVFSILFSLQAATAKRPAADSASKTPAPEKKAKVVTPAGGQKTGCFVFPS